MNADQIVSACEALLGRSDKPTVPEVRPLVEAYYAISGNEAGGTLHVVLDDNNVGDAWVQHCIAYAEQSGDAAGVALGKVLLRMSRTQRLKV